MRSLTVFIWGILLTASCKLNKSNSSWQYSTEQRPSLICKDTTSVTLKIEFLRGCTERELRQISATDEGNQMRILSSSLVSDKGQVFYVSKDSFFNALLLFQKASAEQKGCGGFAGGTGVSIEKHSKGMMTYFGYCQEYGQDEGWNGIEYFFRLMGRKLENYPFK